MKKIFFNTVKILAVFILLIVIGVAVLYAISPKPATLPKRVANIAELETALEQMTAAGSPPGLSLVVVKNGAIVYSRGFGLADAPNRISAKPETVYKWWSMTKMATALAILQLHEQGKLNIDDPVINYLPYFDVQYPSPASQVVTIRMLLTHSSGLPDNAPEVVGWMHLENEAHPDQSLFIQKELPDYAKLRFEPGTQAVYTNVGYMVLGAIIEAVSGETYEDYVINHILQPLKMNHTNFVYTPEMLSDAAVGSHPLLNVQTALLPFFYPNLNQYIRQTQGWRLWFNRFYAKSSPPTGLIGPASDVARLMLAYLNEGELDGARILEPETVHKMTYDSHLASEVNLQSDEPLQGLGWQVFREKSPLIIQHGGGGPGFGTMMRLVPEESLGFIIMANDTTYDQSSILDLLSGLAW